MQQGHSFLASRVRRRLARLVVACACLLLSVRSEASEGDVPILMIYEAPEGCVTAEEFLASVAGCGVRSPFSLCAIGKVGELRVAGQGVDVPLTASGLMVQSGLRLTAWHTFGYRTYIMARAEGLVRLTDGTVTLDSMPVWSTPRFAALLGIDVAIRFR